MPRKTNATFSFQSETGDYIGQGESKSYALADTTFNIPHSNRNEVVLHVKNDTDDWHLEFAAPKGQRLCNGKTYVGATRFGFHEGEEPGLTMSGCGRGANRSSGEFTIDHIQFNKAGELVMFKAYFVHRDVGFADLDKHELIPAVRGKIYFYKR